MALTVTLWALGERGRVWEHEETPGKRWESVRRTEREVLIKFLQLNRRH